MCGIVGYAGDQLAAPILLRGLRDLEYRGYDSAGIAVLEGEGEVAVVKREGKLEKLREALEGGQALSGTTGMGHTRWATHGKPSDRNAHPHSSCNGEVVVIHNGIVENYATLRAELVAAGHRFESETDTETIAHLVEVAMGEGGDLLEALRRTAGRLEGSQAIVAMSSREPGALGAARVGNAGGIVVGHGKGEMLLSSDLAAILSHTQMVSFLADGQLARLDRGGVRFVDMDGKRLDIRPQRVALDPVGALKGQYPHFMLKEVMEQPEALSDTIRSLVTIEPADVHLDDLGEAAERLAEIERVILIGMGTSLNAAIVGRRYIEELALVPAEVDNASEFRYRSPIIDGRTLVVSVSQSGETVDVLEAMAVARERGAVQITICNTPGAQTTRVADGTVYTRAGLERGVASTKCFTTAMAALYGLALGLGVAKGHLGPGELPQRIRDLSLVPDAVGRSLSSAEACKQAAHRFASARNFLFLGRGLAYPVALEGALKMKEISYIHAEGYAAGEMKHGPIALIEASFPAVAVATRHALRTKIGSNIEQVRARDGEVLAIATQGDTEIERLASVVLWVPPVAELLEPIVASIPLQLLAYHVAVKRGCDVDQPRNLAKTVTVE